MLVLLVAVSLILKAGEAVQPQEGALAPPLRSPLLHTHPSSFFHCIPPLDLIFSLLHLPLSCVILRLLYHISDYFPKKNVFSLQIPTKSRLSFFMRKSY
ncbi:hypothetical protein PRIPAC_84127 [Pristionchus pacificus]|nr:hypothetical protein PRIPAC_84127 [Pristionchus pacificus]